MTVLLRPSERTTVRSASRRMLARMSARAASGAVATTRAAAGRDPTAERNRCDTDRLTRRWAAWRQRARQPGKIDLTRYGDQSDHGRRRDDPGQRRARFLLMLLYRPVEQGGRLRIDGANGLFGDHLPGAGDGGALLEGGRYV